VIALWLPVVAWMAAIYYGSTMSTVPGPAATVSDTVLHMSGYAGLAVLTLRATSRAKWVGVTLRALTLALVIATAHGLTVEWLQMHVPTRSAEWRDVVNDVLGALLGLLPVWAWSKIRAA
jgi:VanZ family protein